MLTSALLLVLFAFAQALPEHDEAPIFSVNGTFNTHFSARVTGLRPGACILFEAQARAPQPDGELCLSEAGVRLTGVTVEGAHPYDAGRLLPLGCDAAGFKIAEVITDDPESCFLEAGARLDDPAHIRETCDPKSPFSYQFIDPTRHMKDYTGESAKHHPLQQLCNQLLEAAPKDGSSMLHANAAALDRSRYAGSYKGKCLKSATYVVVNPCNASIHEMLFEGTSRQCGSELEDVDLGFALCSREQGGPISPGIAGGLASALSGIVIVVLIAAAAAAAVVLFLRKQRSGLNAQRREEQTELTSGAFSSSSDPDVVDKPPVTDKAAAYDRV